MRDIEDVSMCSYKQYRARSFTQYLYVGISVPYKEIAFNSLLSRTTLRNMMISSS